MKRFFSRLHGQDWFYGLLLLILAAVAYLVFINRLGFFGDDWYILFDARTQGPNFLHVVYASDRPLRAYLLFLCYKLFGDRLVYYHLSAFFFRYLSALAFYWTLNRVWAGRKTAHFIMALFFLLYPGFLGQFQPVDYQAQSVGLGLAMISIALTIQALLTKSTFLKIVLIMIVIGTGWVYLGLVEYYIGLEFLRVAFVILLVWPQVIGTWKRKAVRVLFSWLPSALAPASFLVWRLLFFTSARNATNVGAQLGQFFDSPLLTGGHWSVNMLYGLIYTPFGAWLIPFYNMVARGWLHLRDAILILGMSAVMTALVFTCLWFWNKKEISDPAERTWLRSVLICGAVSMFFGLLPVILVNRTVDYENSRYALAGVPGAVMLIVAGLYELKSQLLRVGLTGFLVFISISMHLGNALNHAYQADSLRNFWWQVSWRAPHIEENTTLVAAYSLMETPEDYVIWGPANLIYYPENQNKAPIHISLPAALAVRENIPSIIVNSSLQTFNERGNLVSPDFGKMLVMAQSNPGACVHIFDGSLLELSPQDSSEIMLAASHSSIGTIGRGGSSAVPPAAIFGPEPAHTWCYVYEKAALAAQFGDWETVQSLGEQASAQSLKPSDPIEWMPFLRADVATGNIDALLPYVDVMRFNLLIRRETCQILFETAKGAHPEDKSVTDFVDVHFCH
jgi:hypothetical protein